MTSTSSAHATGLPIALIQADPLPVLAGRQLAANQAEERIAQEHAINEVLIALTAMLEEAARG